MNHCMLEVLVKKAPTIRFTQDNKTPLAEIEAEFDEIDAKFDEIDAEFHEMEAELEEA